MKSRVEAQNVEVQYGSSADQVQNTSAVFKCRCIDKRSDEVQLVGNKLGVEQSWSLEAAQEQERTEQAQLQTKRGTDAEADLEDQLKDEIKEAGEEKKRALYDLKKKQLDEETS
ncbi:endoglucanase 19-like [Dorcoceras hygrometricum]|uniref:Endoglucanase 19-like n=1 Tax=Dorcoceras hygrometricum TaxID=472368 RepID=A0A2Z7AMG2_9LAMI|nr:endoglucanase 19-like [Dorcoceras hygrometricum]